MMAREELTAEIVRELLDYDPSTGVFTWRQRPLRVGRERADRAWNTRYAGKRTGNRVLSGHLQILIFGRQYSAHRLAWIYVKGEWPEHEVDHWDTNPSNNRWGNLRAATRSQNEANKNLTVRNSSGFKGVNWETRRQKWRAEIQVNRAHIFLGYFDTAEAAYAAYVAAAEKYFSEFARAA
jgi:hypothetical protein